VNQSDLPPTIQPVAPIPRVWLGVSTEVWTYGVVLAGLLICFLIANVSNTVILKHFAWPFSYIQHLTTRGLDPDIGYGADKYLRFSIGALKRAIYFASLLAIIIAIRGTFTPLRPPLANRALWLNLLGGLALASIFILQFRAAGHGLIYAKLSLDPFMQELSYWNRRVLLLALANLIQLTGVMYTLAVWIVAIAVIALVSVWLKTRGVVLSWLELAGLYTLGLFGATLGMPGYPEILVLGLALLAMLDFDRRGRSGPVQIACFGLALMSHESAAAVAFTALAWFYFDRRFLLAWALLLALYLFTWLLPYGFDVHAAFAMGTAAGQSNSVHLFELYYMRSLFAAAVDFKFLALVAIAAVVMLLRDGKLRQAAFIAAAPFGGFLLNVVASDYSRMTAFGTVGMLAALPVVLPHLSVNQRRALAVGNLLFPTYVVTAHGGIHMYDGLYGWAFGLTM
jgi:hypothetical protein